MNKINNSKASLLKTYNASTKKKMTIMLLSVVIMIFLSLLFTTVGEGDITLKQVCDAIASALTGDLTDTTEKVLVHLRLPRIILAILAGIGLSISGVAMQSITRNPLASPFTVGISSAAAFGASTAIVFGIGLFPRTELGIVLNAFLFSLACAIIVYFISIKVGMTPESIILTGIALNYLFSAATSTIEFFANEHQLAAVVNWSFGTLNGAEWNEVVVVLGFTLVCSILIFCFAPALNIMTSGDDQVAKSLGINVPRVRVITGILSVLMTASIISFTGVIGFIGLAGPHIARMVIGSDHRYLIPFSALAGALLMLIADTIGRVLLAPVIIPVGIVISFLGVPIFLNLILTRRRGYFR